MGRQPRLVLPVVSKYITDDPAGYRSVYEERSGIEPQSPAEALMELLGLQLNLNGWKVQPQIKPGKYYGIKIRKKF